MPDISIKQEQEVNSNNTEALVRPSSAMSTELSAALKDEQEHSNALLVHACNCDDAQCRNLEFQGLCSHMKRFLRAACWASHSERWRSYPIATTVVELFAYHALHCQALQCNVPMCRQLRGQVLL
eukprot:jgi/Phyca11/526049/estExt2_fgenesh1_pm.C_PHYCAscaffold_60143